MMKGKKKMKKNECKCSKCLCRQCVNSVCDGAVECGFNFNCYKYNSDSDNDFTCINFLKSEIFKNENE